MEGFAGALGTEARQGADQRNGRGENRDRDQQVHGQADRNAEPPRYFKAVRMVPQGYEWTVEAYNGAGQLLSECG